MSTRSSNTPAPLAVDLRPSRRLLVWLLALGSLALAAICSSGAPWPLMSLFLVALGIYLTACVRRARSPRCRGLRWDGERWLRIGADGRSSVLRLLRAVVWPQLVALEFQGAAGREYVVLLADSTAPDQLRRLRLYLRHLPVYGIHRGLAG